MKPDGRLEHILVSRGGPCSPTGRHHSQCTRSMEPWWTHDGWDSVRLEVRARWRVTCMTLPARKGHAFCSKQNLLWTLEKAIEFYEILTTKKLYPNLPDLGYFPVPDNHTQWRWGYRGQGWLRTPEFLCRSVCSIIRSWWWAMLVECTHVKNENKYSWDSFEKSFQSGKKKIHMHAQVMKYYHFCDFTCIEYSCICI